MHQPDSSLNSCGGFAAVLCGKAATAKVRRLFILFCVILRVIDTMLKKRATIPAMLIFGALLSLASLSISCGYIRETKLKNEGKAVAAKVEAFKQKNSRLPNSLTEIGIKEDESGPIYYQKESDQKYVLWFGTGLGESETYDSEARQWSP